MLWVLRSTRSGRVFNPTALRCDTPAITDLLVNPLRVDIDTSNLFRNAVELENTHSAEDDFGGVRRRLHHAPMPPEPSGCFGLHPARIPSAQRAESRVAVAVGMGLVAKEALFRGATKRGAGQGEEM